MTLIAGLAEGTVWVIGREIVDPPPGAPCPRNGGMRGCGCGASVAAAVAPPASWRWIGVAVARRGVRGRAAGAARGTDGDGAVIAVDVRAPTAPARGVAAWVPGIDVATAVGTKAASPWCAVVREDGLDRGGTFKGVAGRVAGCRPGDSEAQGRGEAAWVTGIDVATAAGSGAAPSWCAVVREDGLDRGGMAEEAAERVVGSLSGDRETVVGWAFACEEGPFGAFALVNRSGSWRAVVKSRAANSREARRRAAASGSDG